MAIPLIVPLLAAGTAFSVFGQLSQGQAQADAAEQAAKMRELEAQEVLERLNINRAAIFQQGERFKVRQRGAIAGQGRLSNDSTLSMLEDTNAQVVREIYNMEREATFKANQLRTEAGYTRGMGEEANRAAQWNAFGTILTRSAQAVDYIGAGSKPKVSPNKDPNSLSSWDLGSRPIFSPLNRYGSSWGNQ